MICVKVCVIKILFILLGTCLFIIKSSIYYFVILVCFSSEYSAFWRCVKAGAAYLVTQLCKVKFIIRLELCLETIILLFELFSYERCYHMINSCFVKEMEPCFCNHIHHLVTILVNSRFKKERALIKDNGRYLAQIFV